MRRPALQRLVLRSLRAGSLACFLLGAPSLLAQQVSPAEGVQITLDRAGPALVRELRQVQLANGENRVRLYGFAPRILTETVTVRSLGAPATLKLLDQSFWFEVLDRTQLLKTQVGRKIHVTQAEGAVSTTYEGRLLLPPVIHGPGLPARLPLYLEQDDGRVVVLEDGLLEVEKLPQGDYHMARLDWTLACTRADRHRLELLYQTEGLTWSPHLSLRLDDKGTTADLLCVATVHNECGRAFSSCTLQFQDRGQVEREAGLLSRERPSATLYGLDGDANLQAARSQQFVLAQATGLTADPQLVVIVDVPPGDHAYHVERTSVQRALVLSNLAGVGLGMPLPAGPLEVIQVDARNRPALMARTGFRGAEAGDPVLFPLGAEPGMAARWSRRAHRNPEEGQEGVDLQAHLINETSTAHIVDLWCPRPLGSRVESENTPVRLRGPYAVLTVEVPAAGAITVNWSVVSP